LLFEFGERLVAHQLDLDPFFLLLGQQVVFVDLFFFFVEGFDDDTDEEVQEKQVNQDFDENTENNKNGLVLDYGLHVFVGGVDLGPHAVDPAFGGLEAEEGEDTAQGVVEVKVVVYPFTAVVKTVPLTLD
jgi:hypothetical protein